MLVEMWHFFILKCGRIIFPQGSGNIIPPQLRKYDEGGSSCNLSIYLLKKMLKKNHGNEKNNNIEKTQVDNKFL